MITTKTPKKKIIKPLSKRYSTEVVWKKRLCHWGNLEEVGLDHRRLQVSGKRAFELAERKRLRFQKWRGYCHRTKVAGLYLDPWEVVVELE